VWVPVQEWGDRTRPRVPQQIACCKLSTTVMSWRRYAWGVLLCASAFAAVAKGWEHGWDTPTDFWWGDFGEVHIQLTACMLQCACSSGSLHTRTTHALHGCAHSVHAWCVSCVDWVWGTTRAMLSPSGRTTMACCNHCFHIGAAAAVLLPHTQAGTQLGTSWCSTNTRSVGSVQLIQLIAYALSTCTRQPCCEAFHANQCKSCRPQ
jgi:hypothetical protein